MRNNSPERYPLNRSPFWRMQKLEEFAAILGLSRKADLKKLIDQREYLYYTDIKLLGGKKRFIAKPIQLMGAVHERLKDLFCRIHQPDHIYSPRKGKTPKQNAEAHRSSQMIFKLDIRQFYPSTTREHVFRFCLHTLHMSKHVAGAFSKLVTFEGRLPFGSPLSPILCTFVHKDVFDRISVLSRLEGHSFTVWVDDLVVSGDQIANSLIRKIKATIRAKGLEPHKPRLGLLKDGIEITGNFISGSTIAPSQKMHVKIRDNLQKLDNTMNPQERLSLIQSLIGQLNYIRTIYLPGSEQLRRADARRQWLHEERRKIQNGVARNHQPTMHSRTVPWD